MHLRDPKELTINFLETLRSTPLNEESSTTDIRKVEAEFARLYAMDAKFVQVLKPQAQAILATELKSEELAQIQIIFDKGNLQNYSIKQKFDAFRQSVAPKSPSSSPTDHRSKVVAPPRPTSPPPPIPKGRTPSASPKQTAKHTPPARTLPATPETRRETADTQQKYTGPRQFETTRSTDDSNKAASPIKPKGPIRSKGT